MLFMLTISIEIRSYKVNNLFVIMRGVLEKGCVAEKRKRCFLGTFF